MSNLLTNNWVRIILAKGKRMLKSAVYCVCEVSVIREQVVHKKLIHKVNCRLFGFISLDLGGYKIKLSLLKL